MLVSPLDAFSGVVASGMVYHRPSLWACSIASALAICNCAQVEGRLQDGTWLRLEAGHWVADPYPPAVVVAIPPGQAHCPPGLAKKGCVPPGLQKKGGYPPASVKKGN